MSDCIIVIVPAAQQATANSLFAALGQGPGNFGMALTDGTAAVTHYGTCYGWAPASLVSDLDSIAAGTIPAGVNLAANNIKVADVTALVAAWDYDKSQPGTPVDQWQADLAKHNLSEVSA